MTTTISIEQQIIRDAVSYDKLVAGKLYEFVFSEDYDGPITSIIGIAIRLPQAPNRGFLPLVNLPISLTPISATMPWLLEADIRSNGTFYPWTGILSVKSEL